MQKKTDQLILELRRKYRQENSDTRAQEQQGFQEVSLYDGLCTIMLPANLNDMKREHRYAKYRSLTRPEVVMTDKNADATFTFSLAGQAAEGEKPEQRMESLRADMQKVWKQAVFYDTGVVMAGEIPVPWMDCKTFCLNGSLYCLLFLFELQKQLIMGNFHCSFPQYDRWKPVVLRVLETIEKKGADDN
ncbi:MAG: hypothetical protein K2O15_14605 [Lachnospiraceae bacterium]|nr:hypothetical protein [Lachnospiraceae bacterium]